MDKNKQQRRSGTGISRRGVLQGSAALGTAALISPLVTRRAAAAPKKGGVLRIALAHGQTSDNYDPGSWTNAYVQVFAHARHGYLTEVAADGSLIGEIAESWESSPDASVWTFAIRPGITYHSGKTVTPEDVVASLKFHQGDESTSAAKPFVDPIKELKVDGNNVIITLESGNADFPFIMSDYHLPIMPATADGKIDPKSPDGAGGYIVKEYEPGVRASLERNPNYWKTDRAFFDGIEMLSILDPAARQSALRTGDVDVIDQVDLKTVHLFNRVPDVTVLSTTGTQHYTFAMDTRAEPFSDPNVRLALKHSIDRQELVDKILFGYGDIGNDHPISKSNRYHADLEQNSYDPEKAKAYLKKAGLDSLDVSLSAADAAYSGAVDAALLYAEQAKPAGINIKVVREPNDGYWSDVWMKKPWSAVYWGGRPTEDWMFTTAYAKGAAWNDSFWDNERFNKLLVEARSELDDDKRREMYGEMQDIVRTDGGVIVPMFASYVMAHNNKVKTPEVVGANWTLDGFRAPERWWFE